MIATAPGKLILSGEYAVLDGAPALVIAIDRRVVARRGTPHERSAFLAAVGEELARRGLGEAARAAEEIVVDSSALYERDTKLGLGSSAAVTVAATALALGATERAQVLDVALAAHAAAQGARGARGSGADVAAAVYGGAIVFTAGAVEGVRWPAGVRLLPFFTGGAADTATLVAAVQRARAERPREVEHALGAVAAASRALCAVLRRPFGDQVIVAFDAAALAIDRLADATGVDLVPACVTAARSALSPLGGTAKTTGAGGGDVAIAVIPATIDVTIAAGLLIEAGCQPLPLALEETGVDFAPAPQ